MSSGLILHLLIDVVVLIVAIYYKDYIVGIVMQIFYGTYKSYDDLPKPNKLGEHIDILIDDEIEIDEYISIEHNTIFEDLIAA